MDSEKKKILVIVVVIVAGVAAAGSAFWSFTKDQVKVVRQGGPPPAGKLWGKAAMMQHDSGQGKASAPSPKGGGNPANGG